MASQTWDDRLERVYGDELHIFESLTKLAPEVGYDPTTSTLTVWRSTDWAILELISCPLRHTSGLDERRLLWTAVSYLFNVAVRSFTLAICFQRGQWQDNLLIYPTTSKIPTTLPVHMSTQYWYGYLTTLLLVILNLTLSYAAPVRRSICSYC